MWWPWAPGASPWTRRRKSGNRPLPCLARTRGHRGLVRAGFDKNASIYVSSFLPSLGKGTDVLRIYLQTPEIWRLNLLWTHSLVPDPPGRAGWAQRLPPPGTASASHEQLAGLWPQFPFLFLFCGWGAFKLYCEQIHLCILQSGLPLTVF